MTHKTRKYGPQYRHLSPDKTLIIVTYRYKVKCVISPSVFLKEWKSFTSYSHYCYCKMIILLTYYQLFTYIVSWASMLIKTFVFVDVIVNDVSLHTALLIRILVFITYQALTHWGREKMDATSQTTFSSAFSWMKVFEFRSKCHWSLFLRVQSTIF